MCVYVRVCVCVCTVRVSCHRPLSRQAEVMSGPFSRQSNAPDLYLAPTTSLDQGQPSKFSGRFGDRLVLHTKEGRPDLELWQAAAASRVDPINPQAGSRLVSVVR